MVISLIPEHAEKRHTEQLAGFPQSKTLAVCRDLDLESTHSDDKSIMLF